MEANVRKLTVSMATHRPRRMRLGEVKDIFYQAAFAFQWPLIGQGACAWIWYSSSSTFSRPRFNGHSSAKAHAPISPTPRTCLPPDWSFNGHSSAKAHAPQVGGEAQAALAREFQWPLIGQGACAKPFARRASLQTTSVSMATHRPRRMRQHRDWMRKARAEMVSMATHRPRRMRRAAGVGAHDVQGPRVSMATHRPRRMRRCRLDELGPAALQFQWPLIGQGACAKTRRSLTTQKCPVSMATHRPRRMRPSEVTIAGRKATCFNGHSSAKAHAPRPRSGSTTT